MKDPERAQSSQGSLWAWVPATLLGSMLLGLGAMAYVAIDDPHFALEPDYYDKAVHWERSQAQTRESERLGLHLTLRDLRAKPDGTASFVLRVEDSRGLPVVGAAVHAECFPNAYASQIEQVSLRETSPGVYTGQLTRARVGLWELRVGIQQAATTYKEVLRHDLVKADAA